MAQGLLAGSAVGGALTILAPFGLALAISTFDRTQAGDGFDPGAVLVGLVLILLAAVFWLTGLVVIGLPGWWLMHRLKLRGWSSSATLGAVLAPIGAAPLGLFYPVFIAAFAAAGAIVGAVVWRVAYRPVQAPEDRQP